MSTKSESSTDPSTEHGVTSGIALVEGGGGRGGERSIETHKESTDAIDVDEDADVADEVEPEEDPWELEDESSIDANNAATE